VTELTWKSACCRKQGCPEVAVDAEHIYIKDDHGGQIMLTPDELDSIIYTLAKQEMESVSCCGGYCVHDFTDEYGVGDDEKMKKGAE
jgi:hypothetical protein